MNKKSSQYVLLFAVIALVGAVIGLFLANLVFVAWQKIPSGYYGAMTIFKYKAMFGTVPAVARAVNVSLAIIPLTSFLFVLITALAVFAKPKRELHGSARFANDAEIRQTGFILSPKEQQKQLAKVPSSPSVLIGKHKETFLEFFGNEFMSIAAPTRSGKGVAIVIPNLLHYRDSIVVLDIKNENYDLTAGFRSKYQDVYLFSPSPELSDENGKSIYRSHSYNPLDYISRDEVQRMSDIQNIANILYPSNTGNSTSDFFNDQAQRLFTGFVLYMMETPERPCSLAELVRLAESPIPLPDWIENTIEIRKQEKRPLSIECIQAFMSYAGNPAENTRGGIDSTMKAPLNIFTDPIVASATSTSDFRLDEVRKKKMTIYVGIQPNELDRFSKLLNIFFSQLININTRVLPEKDSSLKYQCLVLLDEFTALGKVDIIQKSVAYIAGYNMRLMLIYQSKSQVEGVYGREGAKDIFANIACQVEYTPTEQEQADDLSRKLGTETVKSRSISRNRGKGGAGRSVSMSDQRRELMLPQELKEMSNEQQIIFFRRTKPIMCKKAFYYASPKVFGSRMQRLDFPAKGLPVAQDKLPPRLDIELMLAVMRNIEKTEPKTYKDIQDIAHYQQNHADFVNILGEAFGFDVVQKDYLLKLDEQSKVTTEDDEDSDVVDFDLSDESEFDADFVSDTKQDIDLLF